MTQEKQKEENVSQGRSKSQVLTKTGVPTTSFLNLRLPSALYSSDHPSGRSNLVCSPDRSLAHVALDNTYIGFAAAVLTSP